MRFFQSKDIPGTAGDNVIQASRLDSAIVSVLFPGHDTCPEIVEQNDLVFRKDTSMYLERKGHSVCNLQRSRKDRQLARQTHRLPSAEADLLSKYLHLHLYQGHRMKQIQENVAI